MYFGEVVMYTELYVYKYIYIKLTDTLSVAKHMCFVHRKWRDLHCDTKSLRNLLLYYDTVLFVSFVTTYYLQIMYLLTCLETVSVCMQVYVDADIFTCVTVTM